MPEPSEEEVVEVSKEMVFEFVKAMIPDAEPWMEFSLSATDDDRILIHAPNGTVYGPFDAPTGE